MFDKLQLIAAERERNAKGVKKQDHLKQSKRAPPAKPEQAPAPAPGAPVAQSAGGVETEAGPDSGAVTKQGWEEEEEQEYSVDEAELKAPVDMCVSFMDGHRAASLEANLDYMRKKFGFYIPDLEFVCDLPGLLKYCTKKVRAGRLCLRCDRAFPSADAAVQHMVDKSHCKMPWDTEDDFAEFEDYYDYSPLLVPSSDDEEETDAEADAGLEGLSEKRLTKLAQQRSQRVALARQKECFEVELMETGELMVLNKETGEQRIVGNRDFAVLYKQRSRPEDVRPSVVAASKERALQLYKRAGVDMDSTALATRLPGSGVPLWLSKTVAKMQRRAQNQQKYQQLQVGMQTNLLTKNRIRQKKSMGAGLGVHG